MRTMKRKDGRRRPRIARLNENPSSDRGREESSNLGRNDVKYVKGGDVPHSTLFPSTTLKKSPANSGHRNFWFQKYESTVMVRIAERMPDTTPVLRSWPNDMLLVNRACKQSGARKRAISPRKTAAANVRMAMDAAVR